MILGGGLFRLPNDLPNPFWRYLVHFVAFHRYAYQGLFKNEVEGLRFAKIGTSKYISGEEILRYKWQVVDSEIFLVMIVL
ncbi:hypothetical protein RYX36_018328 [Vicia faba]